MRSTSVPTSQVVSTRPPTSPWGPGTTRSTVGPGRPVRPVEVAPQPARGAPGQPVAGTQRPGTQAGQHVGGAGPEEPGRGDPPGHADIGAQAAVHAADADDLAVRHRQDGAVGDRVPVDRHLDPSRADHGQVPVADHAERRSDRRALEDGVRLGRSRGAG